MKKKGFIGLIGGLSCLLFLAGCGTAENSGSTDSSASATSTSETSTTISTETSSEPASVGSWSEIDQMLQEKTEAESMEVLYESNEAIVNEAEDVSVIVEGYQYLQIENFSRDFRIPFGDQFEVGGVVLLAVTFENNSDATVYPDANFSMSVTGYDSSIARNNSLIENDLVSQMVSASYAVPAGESVSGFIAMSVAPEAMEKIDEYQEGTLSLSAVYSVESSFKSEDTIVASKDVRIPFSGSGESSVSDGEFYSDKLTVENWGEKTLITSEEIGETAEFEDISVSFDGYQVSDFSPNEDQSSRFSNFETGVVILTAKVTATNNSSTVLNFDGTSATLTVGSVKFMNQNSLEVAPDVPELSTGETGTKYIAFLLDKDSYDKLYKDQSYVLDVSLYNTDFERLTMIGDVDFEFNN
ncbi:DUF5068 domain-containing protein [Enterococcus sp. HY326]|uniref:DUF5068 domain-containing protein n=1 Tax=Enterococcus sp. HY326 TaxID=2971265 RepID=UPI00223EABFB|nr:DUF5068 domain-containing protein [Enterococcus sp. HY326]